MFRPPRHLALAACLTVLAVWAAPAFCQTAPAPQTSQSPRSASVVAPSSARVQIARVGPADAGAAVVLPGASVPSATSVAPAATLPAAPSAPEAETVQPVPQVQPIQIEAAPEKQPVAVAPAAAPAAPVTTATPPPAQTAADKKAAKSRKTEAQTKVDALAARIAPESAPGPAPEPGAKPEGQQAPAVVSEAVPAPKPDQKPDHKLDQKPGQKSDAAPASASAAPATSATPESASSASGAHGGSPGEKPKPSPKQLRADNFRAAKKSMVNNEFYGAVKTFTVLRDDPELEPEMREEILYSLADALFNLHKHEIKESYSLLVDAYQEAMQANPRSPRTPSAIFFLGLVNLKAGNAPEAKGYFSALRAKWPKDPNVPAINYFFGEYFHAMGQFQEAAEEYRYLIDAFPEHGLARDASVNLALTYNQLGEYEKAFQIVEYMEKRWPRFYLEHPAFLRMLGDGAFRTGQWERAKSSYLTYFNLVPGAEDAALAMTRVADAYVQQGRKAAAREMYERTIAEVSARKGAESTAIVDAALIARMRLAEEGVHDAPVIEEMFAVFDRPYNARPAEAYAEILRARPGSPLAAMALLKLGMWQLHQGKHMDALRSAQRFLDEFGQDPLAPRARELGLKAFAEAVDRAAQEGHHARVQEMFSSFPFLADGRADLTPEVRLAVAQAAWRAGETAKALSIVDDFLKPDQGRAMEMALDLAFAIHVDGQRWKDVVKLGEKAKEWRVNEDRMRQMTYAMALAHENLADSEAARPLWAKLFQDRKLGTSQRAYAMYFMARSAFEQGDMDKTNVWGQEALSMFLLEGQDQTRVKDCLRLLIESTARGKHWRNALGWALELEKHMRPEDVEWDAARYRRAEIHKALGETKEWRAILTELAQKNPKGLTGRLATSALSSEAIETSAKKYSQ